MFSGQRDFRAIAMLSAHRQLEQVLRTLPRDSVSTELREVGAKNRAFAVTHGYYYSTQPFVDPDSISDLKVSMGGKLKYRYDFYACRWQRQREVCFIFAVPFSKMATEFFGLLDEGCRVHKRQFKKIVLPELVTKLSSRSSIAANVTATTIRFRVTGGDSVTSSTLSGSDVIASQIYRLTKKSLHGIRLVPRRVRMKYENPPHRISLEADPHGNFTFRVAKDGTNIPALSLILNELASAEVMENTREFPLREGIRSEEDDL